MVESEHSSYISHVQGFSELLESSRNLPTTTSELGSIQLSINEIKKRAKQLRNQKENVKTNHSKAHYLLAGSGLSIEEVDTSLKELQSNQFVEKDLTQEKYQEELDFYLKVKKQESILSSIERLLSTAASDFDSFVNKSLHLDWEQRKIEVRENFGLLTKRRKTSSLSVPSWGRSNNSVLNYASESKLNVNENTLLRDKFERYAKVIHSFNNSRQTLNKFHLIKEIISMSITAGDLRNKQLLESLNVIDNIESPENTAKSSKTYLEKQFMEYVDRLYQRNRNEGLPTNINKIKSFIDFKLKKKDGTWTVKNLTIVNGIPIWALIYYLLRAGLPQESLEVAINGKSSMKKVEQSFLVYLKAYLSSKDNSLPAEFAAKLHTEYNQHIKSALDGDPYKLAVYKIIGRCDLSRKNVSAVTLNVEDWMWFHFMLVKDDISESNSILERFSLKDFQNIVLSHGLQRFGDYFLQVLVLSGLYEEAIKQACLVSEIDGVHLAICLADKKLLHVGSASKSSSATETAIFDGEKNEVNFAALLSNYTKSFRFSDPRIAAEYLILIEIVDSPSQLALCHEAIKELILDTKEFAILLGKINRDGTRIPGVLEERQSLLKLPNSKEFLGKITEQAAYTADEEGRTFDSLLLFQLSEQYDVVVSVINNLLSNLLNNTDLDQPLIGKEDNSETNPVLIADALIGIYLSNLEISKKISTKNIETCLMLLKIAEARKTYTAKQWQNTLLQIENLDFIPCTNEAEARRRAQDLSSLDKNLIKSIPNVLLMTMSCVNKLSQTLQNDTFQNNTKVQQLQSLKNISRNCMIFAGMIQYKMPRETYSELIRLDIELQ